jgi:hypothetical protein
MTTLHSKDTRQVTCNECGFSGSIAAVEVHSCYVQEQGGRCEDYPCCGHTDGDGCQTRAEHTADFYYRNPQFLHEPGSPEWYDALDDQYQGEED